MRLSDAKREFEIRCYYWWVSEFEREINNSFPNLRLFKSGYGRKLYQFMQQLSHRNRLTFARARCKNGSAYLADSGDVMTEEEQNLLDSFAGFFMKKSSLDEESDCGNQTGKPRRLANRLKIRKALVSQFLDSFGTRCVDMKIEKEWDPQFRTKYNGWIVSTQLIIGPKSGDVRYRHIIESEARIPHPSNPRINAPVSTLSSGVTWIVNGWEDVFDGDVEEVGRALVRYVGYFFDVSPKLLKGLDLQLILPSVETLPATGPTASQEQGRS